MSGRIVTTLLAVLTCAVVVAAQEPAPQAPPTQTPATQAPPAPQAPPSTPRAPSPAPAPQSSSVQADNKLTLTGCVQRGPSASTAAPGAVGTAGSSGDAKFILSNVAKPIGAAGSAASSPSSYRLDAEDSKLAPHVGHKVEITGMLDRAAGSSPLLKVDNVKMIAASCSE